MFVCAVSLGGGGGGKVPCNRAGAKRKMRRRRRKREIRALELELLSGALATEVGVEEEEEEKETGKENWGERGHEEKSSEQRHVSLVAFGRGGWVGGCCTCDDDKTDKLCRQGWRGRCGRQIMLLGGRGGGGSELSLSIERERERESVFLLCTARV